MRPYGGRMGPDKSREEDKPMTAPRLILPGTTYLITRRCTQRQFLLRPSAEVNALLLYGLIYGAVKHEIQLHAFFFASNHYHLVVTDTECRLPLFQAWFNRIVACVLNVKYGRRENFWKLGSYNAVAIRGPGWGDTGSDDTGQEDVMDKIVYTLVNPVAAGLVDRAYKWPGLWSAPMQMAGKTIEAKRPAFFSEGMPKKVKIQLTPPPGFEHLTPTAFANTIAQRVRQAEDALHSQRNGRPFLGSTKVLTQSPQTIPPHPSQVEKKALNPRVAAKDKKRRQGLLKVLQNFLGAYREALQRFCAGEWEVFFPVGTYKMKHFFQTQCETFVQHNPIPT